MIDSATKTETNFKVPIKPARPKPAVTFQNYKMSLITILRLGRNGLAIIYIVCLSIYLSKGRNYRVILNHFYGEDQVLLYKYIKGIHSSSFRN